RARRGSPGGGSRRAGRRSGGAGGASAPGEQRQAEGEGGEARHGQRFHARNATARRRREATWPFEVVIPRCDTHHVRIVIALDLYEGRDLSPAATRARRSRSAPAP